MNKELEERLDFIEYRQELLFDNGSFSRLMFDYNVTRNQHKALMDLFEEYREAIDKGNTVSNSSYESRIGEILPDHKYDYHFAESIAKTLHEEERFEEVFETLYGNSPKFSNYLDSVK